MNNMIYIFIGLFVAIFGISLIIARKTGTARYDERQQLLRGKAYKAAFFVLVAYLCLNVVFYMAVDTEWADLTINLFIGVCLSITVFAVMCILGDAYFPINKAPKKQIVLFGFICLLQLAAAILNLIDTDVLFITDGRVNYHIVHFVLAAMFLTILAALIIKRAKSGQDGAA